MQEQKSNGYSANFKDGSMKTVLIVIQVKHSVHFVDFPPLPLFIGQYLLYCAQGFHEIILVKGPYNGKRSIGVHIT